MNVRMTSINPAWSRRLLGWLALVALIEPWTISALTLELQRRDPVTGAVTLRTEDVEPKRIGVIAVDVWNFHWCKTATVRAKISQTGPTRASSSGNEIAPGKRKPT